MPIANAEILLNSHPIYLSVYPGGEPLINDQCEKYLYDNNSVTIRPTGTESLMGGLWLVDALQERGYSVHTFKLPELFGARQDRINNSGDFLFTAKSIAKEINMRGFDRVVCFDPHSDVMPALIDRCKVVHSDILALNGKFDRFDAVMAPDGGAEKRALRWATELKVPLLHAWKTRDVSTGKISEFGCEPIPNGVYNILLVDDICDGGGTFVGLAEHLKALWAVSLSLFVSHGIFSKGYDTLTKLFDNIYTTDSTLFPDPNFVRVINILSYL